MHHSQPAISIVLPTRNGSRHIREQLQGLAHQETDVAWELLVVDNGSTDGTADLVEALWETSVPLRIVSAPEEANLSYARNVGVAAAGSEYIAFCDDDDIVGPSWVGAMAAALTSHRLVASNMEYDRLNSPSLLVGRARFQSTGVESLFGMPVCAGPGGVQRSLWAELGGNDREFSGTGEDFDFAMRAFRRSGVLPFFAEGAVYHYRMRDKPSAVFRQARAYGRSHAQLWARHGSGRVEPREDLRRAVRDWWWLLSRAPLAAAGRNRSTWLSKLGRRIGRIEMSIRERVVVL
jgi:glycosyltransferase involved in cell wall biosynthesis